MLSLEARGLVEVLRESPSRVVLTDAGRQAIGQSSKVQA
jgi:DNA-binding MarR family transcriptional regulator